MVSLWSTLDIITLDLMFGRLNFGTDVIQDFLSVQDTRENSLSFCTAHSSISNASVVITSS